MNSMNYMILMPLIYLLSLMMVVGYVLYDPRDSVPLGHDGGGLPERDVVSVLPALDARCPPPLSTTCQESDSVNNTTPFTA